jgi:hypothetical protein
MPLIGSKSDVDAKQFTGTAAHAAPRLSQRRTSLLSPVYCILSSVLLHKLRGNFQAPIVNFCLSTLSFTTAAAFF